MGLFGFGKKKEDKPAPSRQQRDQAIQARYGGRPLLLILDNYVVDCLGMLPPEKQAGMAAIVKKAYGGGDDWRKNVRDKLKLSDSLDNSIRQAWAKFHVEHPDTSPFGFAVAFSDQYFVPLMEGTPSERGDRAFNPAQQREAQERKNRSLVILKQQNVPTIAHLPTIETAATAKIRTAEAVARRVTALALVAAYAEPGSFPREELMALLEQRGVASDLTPKEQDFIALANATDRQRAQFTWRYEGVKALMWALGHVDELDVPTAVCNVPAMVSPIAKNDPKKFLAEASLRDVGAILDEADLIYRYHWACVNARVKNQSMPSGLDGGIVIERHHALNWLIGYRDQEWEDVSTDT